ncbi:reverse transcriptase domain-containing protein [Tanacetum coccineum]
MLEKYMTKKYAELSASEKILTDCDVKATNIILQGLPTDIYALINHHRVSKDLCILLEWSKFVTDVKLIDSGLAALMFKQGDDPIDTINKMMSFLSTIVSSRFPTTNNQLRNSSNLRQQATFHDGRVIVQLLQGRQNYYAVGTSGTRANTSGTGGRTSGQQRVVKCFNCQREGHMARQCTEPKRKRDASWFRENVILVEAQGNGKLLTEEELEFLADSGIVEVALMANLSHYNSDVLSEVPHSKHTHNDMLNQSVQEMQYSEQTHLVDYPENEVTSDSNIIPYSQYLLET